jgi:CDGSH-type Zn-finger protein
MTTKQDTTSPITILEKPGKKAYCTCQLSTRIPYCDGAHKGCGPDPLLVDVPEERTVTLCRCGHTKNFPYCDGMHEKLFN